jgi:hypothetical protein|eukprot:COSAG01_NODE_3388_length_6153_cov_2.364057_6_plen_206_part_00
MKHSSPITEENDDVKVKEKAIVSYPRLKYMHIFARAWNDPVYRAAATDRDVQAQRKLMKRTVEPHVTHLILFNTNKTANASFRPHEHVKRALSNLGGVAKATVMMAGSDADVAEVEQSMQNGLPTILLRDTGGSTDDIALKLNESLQTQAARDRNNMRIHNTMPTPEREGDFRADSMEDHLQKLYEHIESGRGKRKEVQLLLRVF